MAPVPKWYSSQPQAPEIGVSQRIKCQTGANTMLESPFRKPWHAMSKAIMLLEQAESR